jgi:hypothetical protein
MGSEELVECACIVMSAAVGHNVCVAANVLAVES